MSSQPSTTTKASQVINHSNRLVRCLIIPLFTFHQNHVYLLKVETASKFLARYQIHASKCWSSWKPWITLNIFQGQHTSKLSWWSSVLPFYSSRMEPDLLLNNLNEAHGRLSYQMPRKCTCSASMTTNQVSLKHCNSKLHQFSKWWSKIQQTMVRFQTISYRSWCRLTTENCIWTSAIHSADSASPLFRFSIILTSQSESDVCLLPYDKWNYA